MSEDTDIENTFRKLGEAALVLLCFILLIPSWIYWSWVATVAWRWFVVPHFPVSPLTVLQMMGLSIAVRLVRGVGIGAPKKDQPTREFAWNAANMVLNPTIGLIIVLALHACGA